LRSWLSPLSSAGTAHLDHQTAEALVRDMLEAADGRSVLLITHRPEGLDLVDEVVVMG
jgi:ABC-type transport system involved in cytochrome bd biosynthesis fused ATPase/permease subunit